MGLQQTCPSGAESEVGLEVMPIDGVTLSDGHCPGERAHPPMIGNRDQRADTQWRSVMAVMALHHRAAGQVAGMPVYRHTLPVDGDPVGGDCQGTILAVEEYHQVVASLRHTYGPAAAAERDVREKEASKVDERRRFLDLLRNRGATSLLEVGAGTGHDSLYFQRQGLRVLCTDLSPAMVELCRAKGLDAQVADFLGLGVPPASSTPFMP